MVPKKTDEPAASPASALTPDPITPDAPDTSTSPMNRRRFIHVVAAGSAAILATSLPRGVDAAARAAKAAPPKPAKPAAAGLERELRNQEKSLADTLRVVRNYDLPPGSEPATVFRAMRARRGGR